MDDDEPAAAAPAARAGAKFKPIKGSRRPQPPKKKQLPLSTLSTRHLILPTENVSGGVSLLRACTNEGKRCDDDSVEAAAPDSATFGDNSVTRETDKVQTQGMQTGECHWNMETLNIVQEEGITTTAYKQHSGKFQPKPRLHDTVIEEPDSRYSVVDYTDTTAANHNSEFMDYVVDSRLNTNTTFYRELQEEEEEDNIPQVPRETVHGRCEPEHQAVSPNTNNAIIGGEENGLENTAEEEEESKKGKGKKALKKRKTSSSEGGGGDASKSPQKKKFKHSSRRQGNRTLEKELLETPDDEIKFLPFRDMLRLVDYRDWMEKKKEAKGGAPVLPPTQDSSHKNASGDKQYYYSQGFDAEDEFGSLVEGETNVVKPDSPVNYQTYMNKTPRTRWSKQDTQLFYEGIGEFGSDLAMVQQLFPERRHHQIKLKFKSEERKFPLKLNEALSTPSKHLVHRHNVIKKLQREAREREEEEAETTTENEEPAKSEGVDGVKELESGDGVKDAEGGDECEDNDDDDDFWNSYKSDL